MIVPASSSRRTMLQLMGAAMLVASCGTGGDEDEDRIGGPGERPVDLEGRSIAVETPVGKLTVDDGRYLVALALIHPDPVSLLAGWSGDVNRISPEMYRQFTARWPALAELPTTPSSAAEFSVESVLAVAPDVAVVSLGSGPTQAQVSQLESAGIAVAYIDFFNQPFENQDDSLALLGRLIGREEQARDYIAFRQRKLDLIASRVSELPESDRPTVFLEAHAGNGPDCCNSPGKGNIGDYIAFAGGRNIGAEVIDAPSGKLNLEYVIDRDPDIYIATGGPHLARTGGFVVGPGFSDEQSRASLRRVASRRGIADLSAVRGARTFGLSHQLLNSPIDIVATEVLAKWMHPELFADMDPRATLDTINRRFLAVPYEGEYWIALDPA